jgi:hypothetical protein
MKNRNNKKDWERLLSEYGEKYSVTYAPMTGTLPHPSEGGFEISGSVRTRASNYDS